MSNILLQSRLERGLTQSELAKLVGISRETISHIETGRRLGTMPMWKKLAKALDVSLDELTTSKAKTSVAQNTEQDKGKK